MHRLLDAAYRRDARLAAASAKERKSLLVPLTIAARAAELSAPADDASQDHAKWAVALASVLAARYPDAGTAGTWAGAADALVAIADTGRDGGDALGFAVNFLLEGACADPAQRHALQKRADALTKRALGADSASPALAASIGSTHLWAAGKLLDGQRKAAKTALKQALECTRAEALGSPASVDAATVFNRAVSFDREHGFALKERYVTEPVEALGGSLRFDVPFSARWVVAQSTPAGEEEAEPSVYVTQTNAAGERIRQLIFRAYPWTESFAFGGSNRVQGDNVKGVAQGLQAMTAERVFAPGARTGKSGKYKLNRQLAGREFSIQGELRGGGGEPLRVLGYVVRGEHQVSFAVLAYLYGEDREIGAGASAVLESMREPEDD